MHHTRGQTISQRLMRIRVVNSECGIPAFKQALLRDSLGRWAAAMVYSLGFFSMLRDPARQTWADQIASTYFHRA